MAWTGRKRDTGLERYANGRAKARKPPEPPDQPHRRGYGSNPLAETVHGRYLLAGAINQQQYLAGTFYGRSRLRYRIAMGSPDSLRSRSDDRAAGDGEDDAKDIAEHEATLRTLGRLAVDLDWVIGQDAMLSDLTAYKAGLDALRRIYGV